MIKKITWIALFLIIISTTFVCGAINNSERISVKYLKTSDGDTMRATINGENVRIRFLGINTPEVSGEDKVEEPWGNEALLYTQNRLDNANKIEIEYDDVADHEDRFGRKLAWIWVDDELFELELLEQGLAKTYMLKNNYKYAKELKEAENKAKNAKVGVWSDEIPESNKPISESNIGETNVEEPLIFEESSSKDSFWLSLVFAIIVILVIIVLTKNKK